MARNTLIIQLSTDEVGIDELHSIEDTLIQAFSQNNLAIVDGHDFGSGECNIFIYPKGPWEPVIERVFAFLKLRRALHKAVIAKRFKVTERYQVVWPESYGGHFSVV